MKVTCPACGSGGSISLFIADIDARKAVLSAAKLPSDCGALVLEYIGYFAPQERFLTASRAANLINDCCNMILNGVNFDRDFIQAPSHIWQRAFQSIDSAHIRRPLKNHHYLLRIVQSELGKKTDIAQHEQHQSRRSEARINNSEMKSVGNILQQTDAPDLLAELTPEARMQAMQSAEKALLEEDFNPQFIVPPLIEQKAREMLEVKNVSD